MTTNRYITDSDRLIVYRYPVARKQSEKIIMLLKDFWEECHDGTLTKEEIGLKLYEAMKGVFGENKNLIRLEYLENLTNYDIDDIWIFDE